jgi:hypothetical protein
MTDITPDKENIEALPDTPLSSEIVKTVDNQIDGISLLPIFKRTDAPSEENIIAILSINEDRKSYLLLFSNNKSKWVGVKTNNVDNLLNGSKKYWDTPADEESDEPRVNQFLKKYYDEDQITYTSTEETNISIRDVIAGIAKSLPNSPVLLDEIPDIVSRLSLLGATTIVEKRHQREALMILVFSKYSSNDSKGSAGLLTYNSGVNQWEVCDWAEIEKYDGIKRINQTYPKALEEHILPHYDESEYKIVEPEVNEYN